MTVPGSLGYDALLVVSFGGPEGPEDVVPFLENVMRGRDVPRSRLEAVAARYQRFGGVSPINGQNRALVAALRTELAGAGLDLPVYWGNRNWHPLLADELAGMAHDGVRRALAFVTSAYGSYSSCRQYREDIARARETVGVAAPAVDKLRLFYNHPRFVDVWVASLQAALAGAGAGTPVLFSAHSIPQAMAATSPYQDQLAETARLVAAGAGISDEQWRLVWQSRSGPPTQPWLEPDLLDTIARLPPGTDCVIVAPIGFVSDHMEVVFDIDHEATEAAAARGVRLVRAATPGVDARFVTMVRELVEERVRAGAPRLAVGRWGPAPDVCETDCCLAPDPVADRRLASKHGRGSQRPRRPSADDAPAIAALKARVGDEVGALLRARDPRARAVVLGAGSDDLESGRHFLALLADGGYAVPTWPTEHGGMGLDRAGAEAVAAVLAGFETPDLYPFLVGLGLIGPTILQHGTDEQKRRWLPPMRSGEEIWCQMFSEPDAGSDLANLKTRAVRDGDSWRLTGSKVWTSRAHYSEWGMLLARSDPSLPKHAGITAFGVDMRTPGVSVRPLVQMNGDSHFNEVFLDDVVVPDGDRLGDVNDGWRVGLTTLSHERGSLAGSLGVSLDGVLRMAKTHAVEADPVARDRLAAAIVELEVNQWSGLRARAARRAGKPPGPEDSGAKLRTTRMIKHVAALGVDVQGPEATVASDDEWQTMFLAAPSLSIRGGTDEIQHNILGERVLGLPPEPRVDKGRPFSERPDRD